MIRLLTVLVTSALLAACISTAAQRQATVISTTNRTASVELRACLQAVYDSPEKAPLRGHLLPPGQRTPDLQQLLDTSHITAEQRQALFVTHPKVVACREKFLNELVAIEPGQVEIIVAEYSAAENELVSLIQGKLTWGEYMQHLKVLNDDTRQRLLEEGQRMNARLQQSHEAELARRQAAAQAFAQYMQTQQAINAASRPVITNCTSAGDTATCVTH